MKLIKNIATKTSTLIRNFQLFWKKCLISLSKIPGFLARPFLSLAKIIRSQFFKIITFLKLSYKRSFKKTISVSAFAKKPFFILKQLRPRSFFSSLKISALLPRLKKIINKREKSQVPSLKLTPLSWSSEFVSAKLSIIAQSFKDAVRFLKNNRRKQWFYRYQRPWYLMLGAENSGKTTLIAHSNIGFVSTDHQAVKVTSPTPYCQWHFSEKAVVLDVSGALVLPATQESDPISLWAGFVKLLRRHRRLKPIDGVIITLDVAVLFLQERNKLQLHLELINHYIQNLAKIVKALPVYLVFTKSDLIAGFTDFFAQLSIEEQSQIFGITLPIHVDQQNFVPLINQHFNTWLSQLHQQIIGRLHQERNPSKYARIKDFPLQIESQKSFIIQLASQINSSQANIRGIYFTSALQEGKSLDFLMRPIAQTLDFRHPYHVLQASQYQHYFVKDTLNAIFATTIPPQVNTLIHKKFWYKFYSIAGGITILAALLGWQSYLTNIDIMDAIKDSVSNELDSSAQSPTPYAFLNKLNILDNARTQFNGGLHSFFTHAGFLQAYHLKKNIDVNYYDTLKNDLIPQLQHILETQLQEATISDPDRLYNTLKAYLMMGKPNQLNPRFVLNWYKNYWHVLLPDDVDSQTKLLNLLTTLMNEKKIQFTLNEQLIKNTRDQLNRLSAAQLTYLLLQDHYGNNFTKLNKTSILIPTFYTASAFNEMYYRVIPQMAHDQNQSNWVLGDSYQNKMIKVSADDLINDTRHIYVDSYIRAWQQQLASLKLADLQNLHDVKKLLDALNGEESPFTAIIQNWQISLEPIITIPEYKQTVDEQITILYQLSSYIHNPTTQKTIAAMAHYIRQIVDDPDLNKAAWTAAKARMDAIPNGESDAIENLMNLSQQAPAPFNTWLNTIATDSWRLLLQSSQDYLNQIWTTEVIPQYNYAIKNHYPIFKDADNQMSINDFNQFFGPNGAISHYFDNYLKPFVDTSQLYWTWKTVDGQKINVAQSSLEMFIRAALIRKMFFGEEGGTQAHIEFALVPDALITTAQDFVLNLEGQEVDYLSDLHKTIPLKWPGPQPNFATAQFIMNGNKQTVLSANGPWAIFKLFDAASLTPSPSSKLFTLSYDFNGNTVRYEIATDNVINPFIPGIVNSFRCPDRL
jgi:type VI secretion system protein ImpL